MQANALMFDLHLLILWLKLFKYYTIMKRHIVGIFFTCFICLSSFAFNPPTMGWSSWNTFATDINENVIKSQADAMVSMGLNKLGYNYINIDDGFWQGRGTDGKVIEDKKLFPHGMRWLVDYIHKKGLKAGIYSDAGINSCAGWKGIGLYQHEKEDCHTYFIDWDFDFLKVDYCGAGLYGLNLPSKETYTRIGDAVKNCGKKGIVYNLCCQAFPGPWVSDVADSWRTTHDIKDNWGNVKDIIYINLNIQAYTGGGHYNDADMLEIGRALNHEEEKTHMAYWCIVSSPLLIGCDLTKIPESSLDLLKNKDLLAMNQDKLGIGAPVVQREGECYVVAKDMKKTFGPQRAVVVMNLSDESKTVPVSIDALGFKGQVKFYDCFTHKDAGTGQNTYSVTLPAHGSAAYYVTGQRIEKTVYQAQEAWLSDYQDHRRKPETPSFVNNAQAGLQTYVTNLGNSSNNYLEWRNIYSVKGGPYEISVRYACKEPRNLSLTVNNSRTFAATDLTSGSENSEWKTLTVNVYFNPGFNVVRLSNVTGKLPNIDCMTVKAL